MIQADRIYYGGDYNPDQWDEATIAEDMRLFKRAGINLLTLPVFSWAKLEPDEGVYDFGWLDAIIDRIWRNGIRVCLATPTSAQPAWLSARYPEVLPVDVQGRKRTHGMRVFFCVNSLKYRERAAAIAAEFGRRYANHPALAMWHVSNEYGTSCYCPNCQAKFRLWLRRRYGGVEALNARWNTAFWGRTVYSFDEIALPTELNDDCRFNPAVQLDYMRFLTDCTVECFANERDVLRSFNPEIPVTTNTSGFIKKLDQFTFAKALDVVGWDNYPSPQDPPHFVAMKHDIMRGLKGGQSFALTEQSPNQQNWQPYNRLKRPGEVRLLSWQAMAHGADTCLFFQMRQSAAGQEKFHGAIISHSGRSDTRVFREAEALGRELQAVGDRFLRARTPAKVAFAMDWNSWWALELSSGPSADTDFLKTMARYYRPFHARNIAVDVVNPAADTDWSGYALVVAPMLYMTKPGVAEALTEYVRGGGALLATVMTGLADENDRCVFGAYPGRLRQALGIWVEETDALRPDEGNRLLVGGPLALQRAEYACGYLCDIVHCDTAEALAVYGDDFYAGVPAVTRNRFGAGSAWYVGTQPEDAFLDELTAAICAERGVEGLFPSDPGVEVTLRAGERGETLFLLNHNAMPACVELGDARLEDVVTGEVLAGRTALAARDVRICRPLPRTEKGRE